MDLTILHVEDEPIISNLVTTALRGFGFSGTILLADSVRDAMALLDERGLNRLPVDLVIVDVRLPDGTGLDVVRKLRRDPLWRLTPVLVLSGEIRQGTINEAYALGVNCYLPKSEKPIMQSLRALYDCWLRSALLPRSGHEEPLERILNKAAVLRARTSDFYLRLAELAASRGEESQFWLERSLAEGNLANLMALFRQRGGGKRVDAGMVERFDGMQLRVEASLKMAERLLQNGVPDTETACRWVLDLMDAIDEELVAELLGYLFPKSPVATKVLKERAVAQVQELVAFIFERTEDRELRRRGEELRRRLAAIEASPSGAGP